MSNKTTMVLTFIVSVVVPVVLIVHLRTVILFDPFGHQAKNTIGDLQLAVRQFCEVICYFAVIDSVFVPRHVIFLHVVAYQCNEILFFFSFGASLHQTDLLP